MREKAFCQSGYFDKQDPELKQKRKELNHEGV